MQLTQKETELLKDLKGQERLCIDKYTAHSQSAVDPQLKNLFSQIAGIEQNHFDTLTQIENGQTPQMNSGGGQQNTTPQFTANYGMENSKDKSNDCYLCSDALSTEKHASSLYDTSIFEFSDSNLRDVLNHIQKEEQNHGKMIYDYMNVNSMYS